MMIKIAASFLALALLASCQTTQTTAARSTMQQRLLAQNTSGPGAIDEPPPPAEGPEDIPAEGPADPHRNPSLLPTPLLRANAAAGL